MHHQPRDSYVKILEAEAGAVGLNESTPGFDTVAHQQREQVAGLGGIFHGQPLQLAGRRV